MVGGWVGDKEFGVHHYARELHNYLRINNYFVVVETISLDPTLGSETGSVVSPDNPR